MCRYKLVSVSAVPWFEGVASQTASNLEVFFIYGALPLDLR